MTVSTEILQQENDLVFDFSPSQAAFVFSDAQVVMAVGPMGSGKTFAGIGGLIAHAARCGASIRGALVRDTHTNIKISTVPDIKEILGDFATFHDDDRRMVIHSTPKVEMDLFGIDDQASLSKLQGPQYAIIWLEEPAPIHEKANAGLPRAVFDLSLARASRQRGRLMRVQITQNPADEDHWTEELFHEPPILAEDPDTGARIVKACFRIPYHENTHANALTRAANIAAFKNDPGKYSRYVEGRAAPVQRGKSPAPTYNPSIHYSEQELVVIPGAQGIRGWDAWHNPVCLIAQYVPPGRLIVHEVLTASGVGVQELIESQVLPTLARPKYSGKILDWRDIGDPTMRTPDQSSVSRTTARVLEDLLKTHFEPGPTRWKSRIDPLCTALRTNATDGRPQILISSSARPLHRSLNGGWHYKVDNNGNVIGNTPVQDQHDHQAQALAYIVSRIFPLGMGGPAQQYGKKQSGAASTRRMERAMSYASASRQGTRIAGDKFS